MSRLLNRMVVSLASFGVVLGVSACGYALAGRGNTLPVTIKTIGVPAFVNHSPLPEIDKIVTDAVTAEFQSRGRLRVKPDEAGPDIDAVLKGTITSLTFLPSGLTASGQASSYNVVLTASLEFRHVTDNNKVLWSNPAAQQRDDFSVTTTSASDPFAGFRQDKNAIDRLAKSFAKTIVTSILEAF